MKAVWQLSWSEQVSGCTEIWTAYLPVCLAAGDARHASLRRIPRQGWACFLKQKISNIPVTLKYWFSLEIQQRPGNNYHILMVINKGNI